MLRNQDTTLEPAVSDNLYINIHIKKDFFHVYIYIYMDVYPHISIYLYIPAKRLGKPVPRSQGRVRALVAGGGTIFVWGVPS